MDKNTTTITKRRNIIIRNPPPNMDKTPPLLWGTPSEGPTVYTTAWLISQYSIFFISIPLYKHYSVISECWHISTLLHHLQAVYYIQKK